MISQDHDDDGIVTAEEYFDWGLGWNHLADERGFSDEYRQARQRVFDVWDADGDGVLNQVEQELSQTKDFFAPANRSNSLLSFEEFKSQLRIIAEMNEAVNLDTEVTLINVFEAPKGALEEAIELWKHSHDFLQTQSGVCFHRPAPVDHAGCQIRIGEHRDLGKRRSPIWQHQRRCVPRVNRQQSTV